MRASTQFPMAVHALLMIAYFPEIRVTSEMVAASVGNNPVIIRNLYRKLKQAGLLSIQRGTGTTELARPADEISLWDVYAAVEPHEAAELFRFSEGLSGVCPVGGSIRELLNVHLRSAIDALEHSLSQTSLEELRVELETHHERKLDFPAIVAWYKQNGYADTPSPAPPRRSHP